MISANIELSGQTKNQIGQIEKILLNPPSSAKPWVFWYWMHGAISKAGITADLEAMQLVGIGGAYLMPIKDTSYKIPFSPVARQLTPEWWEMVKHAMTESKRLGLQLAMHVSDGFALAGGPWITPELSMQKLVWTKTYVSPSAGNSITLYKPEAFQNYYEDVAVYAYPAQSKMMFGAGEIPFVTTSNNADASFLTLEHQDKTFRSDSACWIQYAYSSPVTIRAIQVITGGNAYQALRLQLQKSDDGINFSEVVKFDPPRHGWQDADENVTFSIPETTAQYFRFVYDKEGTEPGAEDLDAAKWKPSLKVKGIYPYDESVIHQYESKNGSVWRISKATSTMQVPDETAIPMDKIINLSSKMDAAGNLNWTPPPGNWVIVRMGHTSTGHTNYTGGGALGLECDKFNAKAVQLQFENWFGKAFTETDAALAKEVLKVFHVDSWECGSQNWSKNFAAEFKNRRGYDLMPWLPVMTGLPIENAAASEKVLHDVRQTIGELVNDVFYATLKNAAHEKNCLFSAEAIAPTMMSDGLLHYQHVDLPMGEFWLNSPTHDKPNDMLDAIHGAHIYGKRIIQAESFTSVRMNWAEHPGNLKIIGDRNFALGINKMVMHVFTHNPWMDKKPGMTLDGVGLYYQRDQTWFKQSKAWIEYLTRCQTLLQMGKPVIDIAVFTGEEMPRRSLLPDRLVRTLPGIFGKEKVAEEKHRLTNKGQPMRQKPDGVNHSANMADPEDWVDPLNGYAYDSFNPDALMQMQVKNGRVELPGGASYAVLVIPGVHAMNPNAQMSDAVKNKLQQLAADGARIIMDEKYKSDFKKYKNVALAPYQNEHFETLGLKKDVEVLNAPNKIAWTHRYHEGVDIYFLSNQTDTIQEVQFAFRTANRQLDIMDPVTGNWLLNQQVKIEKMGSYITHTFQPGQSLFFVFNNKNPAGTTTPPATSFSKSMDITSNKWKVQFDEHFGGPKAPIIFDTLKSWTSFENPAIKYYSGSAVYTTAFEWNQKSAKSVSLQLSEINNIATVKINGVDCGTIWTKPYQTDITKALKQGTNTLEIIVSNTWQNRLIGDALLPEAKRVTYTTAPFRLSGKPLLPAGLTGSIKLLVQ